MAVKKAIKKATKKAPAKKANARVNPAGSGIRPDSSLGKALARRTEENLTDAMKRRRDIFVREYLYDFNGANAWRRMMAEVSPDDTRTFTPAQAAEHAYQLRNEPYVAARIKECIEGLEAANMISEQRILGMAIREAELQGIGAKHSARVSAIGMLMDYLNMTSKAKAVAQRVPTGGGGNGLRGGVMVVPDVAGTADEWEAAAAQAQAKLKEEVRK